MSDYQEFLARKISHVDQTGIPGLDPNAES